MNAYRYQERQYNELLIAEGNIKIGTLHDFRRQEHKRGIADSDEGKKIISYYVENFDSNNPHSVRAQTDVRALTKFNLLHNPDNKALRNVKVSNVMMHKVLLADDCFVLCTSKVRSKSTMAQFEGADSCVQIINPRRFYGAVTSVLNARVPVEFHGVREVIYQDREEVWNGSDWGRHPSVIKARHFYAQAELRAIWVPRTLPIQPEILIDDRLVGLCEFVDVA